MSAVPVPASDDTPLDREVNYIIAGQRVRTSKRSQPRSLHDAQKWRVLAAIQSVVITYDHYRPFATLMLTDGSEAKGWFLGNVKIYAGSGVVTARPFHFIGSAAPRLHVAFVGPSTTPALDKIKDCLSARVLDKPTTLISRTHAEACIAGSGKWIHPKLGALCVDELQLQGALAQAGPVSSKLGIYVVPEPLGKEKQFSYSLIRGRAVLQRLLAMPPTVNDAYEVHVCWPHELSYRAYGFTHSLLQFPDFKRHTFVTRMVLLEIGCSKFYKKWLKEEKDLNEAAKSNEKDLASKAALESHKDDLRKLMVEHGGDPDEGGARAGGIQNAAAYCKKLTKLIEYFDLESIGPLHRVALRYKAFSLSAVCDLVNIGCPLDVFKKKLELWLNAGDDFDIAAELNHLQDHHKVLADEAKKLKKTLGTGSQLTSKEDVLQIQARWVEAMAPLTSNDDILADRQAANQGVRSASDDFRRRQALVPGQVVLYHEAANSLDQRRAAGVIHFVDNEAAIDAVVTQSYSAVQLQVGDFMFFCLRPDLPMLVAQRLVAKINDRRTFVLKHHAVFLDGQSDPLWCVVYVQYSQPSESASFPLLEDFAGHSGVRYSYEKFDRYKHLAEYVVDNCSSLFSRRVFCLTNQSMVLRAVVCGTIMASHLDPTCGPVEISYLNATARGSIKDILETLKASDIYIGHVVILDGQAEPTEAGMDLRSSDSGTPVDMKDALMPPPAAVSKRGRGGTARGGIARGNAQSSRGNAQSSRHQAKRGKHTPK